MSRYPYKDGYERGLRYGLMWGVALGAAGVGTVILTVSAWP